MPSSYHSNCLSNEKFGNMARLSFNLKFTNSNSGPIKSLNQEHLRKEDPIDLDIIDEALYFFKSNVFFKQFEILNESDRTLVYLHLFIIECLKLMSRFTASSTTANLDRKLIKQQIINNLCNSHKQIQIPGDLKFQLNHIFRSPSDQSGKDEMRQYLFQLRLECFLRLFDLIWPSNDNLPSKWWICFSKRKFINLNLNEID